MSANLTIPLHDVAMRSPERLALCVDDGDVSYAELARLGRTIAGWLIAASGGRAERIGVLAGRSLGAYAGVVGACWAGGTYVPLSLAWPDDRLIATLRLTQLDALIIDAEAAGRLSPDLCAACPKAILVADAPNAGTAADGLRHLGSLSDRPDLAPVRRDDAHIAYIIFTSGTTGAPKGVQIRLGAITAHLAEIQAVYGFTADERISLAPDLTFDPSILNMFMAWNAGASLHVVPRDHLIAPIDFIQDHALTVWNSTPATIGVLLRLGALAEGALPSLRISIFGGDTLTLEAARAWARAAPASVVDNLYGPTEATIECLHQRLTDPPVVTPGRGSLALGLPYPGVEVAIVDEALSLLPPGETGELAISGRQLAAGYLDQPALTAARFPLIDGVRWYLTGDKAWRDADGRVHHLGRLDDQVKVRGHRVELGDVESHVRAVCGTQQAAAVAWPVGDGSATGIVAFVAGLAGDLDPSTDTIRAAVALRVPPYMAPQSIRRLGRLPMTAHGKVDRRALIALLDAGA